jgi:hypothetical protein
VLFVVIFEAGRPRGSDARVQARTVMCTSGCRARSFRTASYFDIDKGGAAAERLAEERG